MAKDDDSVDKEQESAISKAVLENNEATSDALAPEITLQEEAIVDAVASLLLAVSGQLRSSNSELAADLLEKRQILLKVLEPASKEK